MHRGLLKGKEGADSEGVLKQGGRKGRNRNVLCNGSHRSQERRGSTLQGHQEEAQESQGSSQRGEPSCLQTEARAQTAEFRNGTGGKEEEMVGVEQGKEAC